MFDPIQVGFAWPVETILRSPSGVEMTVRPFAVNFAGLRKVNGRRIDECYRYNTSTHGYLTELEVKKWLAGGDAVCAQLLSTFKDRLSNASGQGMSLSALVDLLQKDGFTVETININLRWFLQDGFVEAQNDGAEWHLQLVME